MAEYITVVSTYVIPNGRLAEWKAAMMEVTELISVNVPRLVSFNVYINDEGTEATGVYVHPDSESLEQHLEVAVSRNNDGIPLVQTSGLALYGSPSDRVVERLRGLSEASNSFPVTVRGHFHGSG